MLKENPKMMVLSVEKGLPVATSSRRNTKMVETKGTERAMYERVREFRDELNKLRMIERSASGVGWS